MPPELNWSSNDVVMHGPYGCLRTIVHAHLAKNVLDMLFDRLVADTKSARDLLVGTTLDKVREDIFLSKCKGHGIALP